MSKKEDSSSRRRFSIWWMVIPVIFILVLTWWLVGFHRYEEPIASGFSSDRRVSFTFENTNLQDALKQLFPEVELTSSDGYLGIPITMKVTEMKECDAMCWISMISFSRFIREGNTIYISERKGPLWIDAHYDAVHEWTQKHLGFSLWPNR